MGGQLGPGWPGLQSQKKPKKEEDDEEEEEEKWGGGDRRGRRGGANVDLKTAQCVVLQ